MRHENELFDIFATGKGGLDELEDGITINGQLINKIRYANDTVLLADSADG